MSEKATFQHLNDELEALVNCQEGSAWESSSELDELRKLLEEEKNTRKLKESKLREVEETTAKLQEQVTFMRNQVSITQSKVKEVESKKNQLVSEISTLREKLEDQKSISEWKQQELDSITSSRNEYRTKWQQTEEKLSRKETELHEVRVRMETRAEENKKRYEALMKEKEEAQATLIEVQRSQVLETFYQSSACTEQELILERDSFKREVEQLKKELTRMERLLKEKEKEWKDQFERTREESKEHLHQVKYCYERELEKVKVHFEQEETHFKTYLGHPLVHDWTTMEAELAKYRRLLDNLKAKQLCHLSIRMENTGGDIFITNLSNKPHNVGGFILRHKVDEQEYLEQKFDEDVSLKPGVPFKVLSAQDMMKCVKTAESESANVWGSGESFATSFLDTNEQEIFTYQYQMNGNSDGTRAEASGGEKGMVSDGAEDHGVKQEESSGSSSSSEDGEGDEREVNGEGGAEMVHTPEEHGEEGETSGSQSSSEN